MYTCTHTNKHDMIYYIILRSSAYGSSPEESDPPLKTRCSPAITLSNRDLVTTPSVITRLNPDLVITRYNLVKSRPR